MWNFCEPWTKRLNLTLKETIMTALDRPGESPPNFFFKKAPWTKQILFFLMEWASYVAEKKWRNSVSHRNSSGPFLHGPPLKLQKTANKYAEKHRIYGSILRKIYQVIDTVNSARLNILRENYTGNFSRQTRHPLIELKTEWGCTSQQLLKF